MKQVGAVTAKQFGYIYIQGVPYSPVKVVRFMSKGVGIKLQDLVIFDFDMIENERVLNYCKNALYADAKENAMVREFVKASELAKAKMVSDELSDQIKKDLAEEGIAIDNTGLVVNQMKDELPQEDYRCEAVDYETEISDEILSVLTNDERRTISIYLQSSLKAAIDCTDCEGEELQEEALKIAKWIDRNSTQIIPRAEHWIKNQKIIEAKK